MEIGVIVSVCALLISFVGLMMNGRKDTRQDAATNAVIQTKLDSLLSGVDDLRVEMRTMRDSITDHGERLSRVEAMANNNSHRLDVIEGGKA